LRGPHGLTLHNQTLWFTAEGSKALGTHNPATRQVMTVLGTGQDKTHLVWVSKDGRKVVASNAGSGTMSFFDRMEVTPVTVPGASSASRSNNVAHRESRCNPMAREPL
jgi:streptogramin lyase